MAEEGKTEKVRSPEDIAAEEAIKALPEPGYQREEALKQRQETLDEKAAALLRKWQTGSIDPKHMKIAREIAARVSELDVSGAQAGRTYRWVSTRREGYHINKAKNEGWEMVQGDDPEADALKKTDGTTVRILGDVVLMWMPEEVFIVKKAMELQRKEEVESGSIGGLLDLADRHRDNVILRPYGMDSLEGPPIAAQRFTRQQAMKVLDGALRRGAVPGMRVK